MKGPRVALAKKVVASAVKSCEREVERHGNRIDRAQERVEEARKHHTEVQADAKDALAERDVLAAAQAVLDGS